MTSDKHFRLLEFAQRLSQASELYSAVEHKRQRAQAEVDRLAAEANDFYLALTTAEQELICCALENAPSGT